MLQIVITSDVDENGDFNVSLVETTNIDRFVPGPSDCSRTLDWTVCKTENILSVVADYFFKTEALKNSEIFD
jgi:hypothetical protein